MAVQVALSVFFHVKVGGDSILQEVGLLELTFSDLMHAVLQRPRDLVPDFEAVFVSVIVSLLHIHRHGEALKQWDSGIRRAR